ncbi:MAG: TetR/AcrR family transcriptional regulator [Gammaproteobacteria bacterium]|nr:TetR/AcrR family transcriptional regulator [Gammaproteobacteria bacterium]
MARPAYSSDVRERIETDIRQAALRLFGEHGYRNVSLRAIGRELNLSATALYRYFDNKEALLAAIRAEGFVELKSRLVEVQNTQESPLAVAREAIKVYLDFALNSRDLFSLMYEFDQAEIAEDPNVAINRRAAFAEAERLSETLLKATGLPGDPNELAHLFWIGAHGLAALAVSHQLDMGKHYDELVEPLIQTLLSRIVARDGETL